MTTDPRHTTSAPTGALLWKLTSPFLARPRSLSYPRVLVSISLLAILARVASALLMGDVVRDLPGVADQVSYDQLARRVVEGYGFSFGANWWPATRAGEPTAHWSYLYTLYLSGVYLVAGPHPLAARLIQAVLAGILTPLLTWRLARHLVPPQAALAAAALASVYGYFVYYAGALMTETFYILAILWALELTLALAHSLSGGGAAKWQHWLLLGVALGIIALLRQVFLLFVPFLALWLVWAAWRAQGTRGVRWAIGGLLAAGLVCLALIIPWTIRNYMAFDRFVLLNTNAGFAFFWGNHPVYGAHFIPILPADTYRQLIPEELRPLNEAALDAALLSRGIGFVLDDPGRYALLSLSRIPPYFMFWPTQESSTLSNVVRVFSSGVYLPLMLGGVVLAATRWRRARETDWANWLLVWGFLLIYSTIHILTWTLIRYRLPVDAVAMPFAGIALMEITSQVGLLRGRSSHKGMATSLATAPKLDVEAS